MFKIGNLKLKSNLILAPMTGVTDLPFRLLSRRFGCELAFIEMLNCRSVSYKSRKTHEMLSADPKDRPLGVQLLGNEPNVICKAMDVLKDFAFDILDFNAACPAKKVVRRGEGASLLKEPRKLNQLLKLMVKNSKIPVTVKIRAGWDKSSLNAREVALFAQDAGISALFIHGRTKMQGRSGQVDYTAICQVKKALEIPLIASGDILSPILVKKMFAETGCDAVAIASGVLGNPWIFRETEYFLKHGRLLEGPDKSEIVETMIEHLNAGVDFYGERPAVLKFHKFFTWYTKGFRKIRILREKLPHLKSKEELISTINKCLLL
jgi:tRNA-dihydrouridine synthase B